jgi:hypothetical protein
MVKYFYWILFIITAFGFTMSNDKQYAKQNDIIDAWHKAASSANFETFFDVMTDDFIYLGTAPGERWNKTEFGAFCKPYFDKGQAWDFKPSNRIWSKGNSKKIIWFTEDLDTWMKGCRGSGIMIKQKGKWKLAYYNLSVLIENEKIESFIQLRLKEVLIIEK